MTQFRTVTDDELTARMEPFDSFWEAPRNIEKGYRRFRKFYSHNYLRHIPPQRDVRILVISCGPGYFVNLLVDRGYKNVVGIDSFPEKVTWAERRGLPCRVARAFRFLGENPPWDVIFAEQEINHLTKGEILAFLALCRRKLVPGGTLVVHSINGTSPLTGAESRAGNFDHYNSFTEYSLRQVLEYTGFERISVFPLNLYVFWSNPLNYAAWVIDRINTLLFRVNFILVGKRARIFTKKLGAACTSPAAPAG
jgi:SAM-dependent methyltransferase